ncbi:hypothetical protein ACFX2I_032473 [Malus domestica]
MEKEGQLTTLAEMDVVGSGVGDWLLSQDSDPFNLLPIIKAVTRGKAKRSRENDDEHVVIVEEGLSRMKKNPRSGKDQAKTTYEGSLRSQ